MKKEKKVQNCTFYGIGQRYPDGRLGYIILSRNARVRKAFLYQHYLPQFKGFSKLLIIKPLSKATLVQTSCDSVFSVPLFHLPPSPF